MYQNLTIVGNTWYIKTYEKSPPEYHYRQFKKRKKSDGWSSSYRRTFSWSRARNTFRNIVAATLDSRRNINQIPTLLTLTTVDGANIKTAYKWLTRFYQLINNRYGKSHTYVCVPEFQQRGAIHFHCLVWGLDREVTDSERDRRTLQNYWRRGYVDCTPTDGSGALSWYLTKYFDGSFSDYRLAGEKAYVSSRGCSRPISYKGIDAIKWEYGNTPLEQLAVEKGLTEIRERRYSTQWLGEATFKTYIPYELVYGCKKSDGGLPSTSADYRNTEEAVGDEWEKWGVEVNSIQDEGYVYNETKND